METKKVKKALTGTVVSSKMDKTIVVRLERMKLHSLYKKSVKINKKIKAHDERNECSVGDIVRVVETRPLSKEKRYRLVEIIQKAK